MRNTHTCVCMHTLETIYFQCLQISLYREDDGYEEDDDDDGFMPRKLFFFSFDHFKVSIYLMISKKTNKQAKKKNYNYSKFHSKS